jgi:hypothetical protein
VYDARDVVGGRAGENGDGLDRHGAYRSRAKTEGRGCAEIEKERKRERRGCGRIRTRVERTR